MRKSISVQDLYIQSNQNKYAVQFYLNANAQKINLLWFNVLPFTIVLEKRDMKGKVSGI